jgi:Peptidase family M48
MADQSDSSGTPARGAGGPSPSGGGAGNAGGGAGNTGGGARGNPNRNRNRNRSRNRSRSGSGSGSRGRSGDASAKAGKKGQGGGGGQRSGQGGNRSRQRSGSTSGGSPRSTPAGQGRSTAAVAVAPAASLPSPVPLHAEPGLGAPQIHPGEVAANRRRVARLCAYTAIVPALLLGVLLAVALSLIVGVVAFLVAGAAVAYGLWRLAPSFALRRIGAEQVDEHGDPRLYNLTEGLCATFGLSMPALHVLDDDVPNACALGRDARRSDLVVTTGLLGRVDPIELEGVIAHELAHVKRGDNGVSSVGITLATLFGGEATLRRCVGQSREYRADVVAVSAVRYPRGLLGALLIAMESPAPSEGSFFATPSRFAPTRWVWIDPCVGHRGDPIDPGDLDATSVRAAALSEW